MESRVGARIVASSVRVGQRHAKTRKATSTRTPASTSTGGSTKRPHKFFLALGRPKGDWDDKDKRDEYRLAIDKALSEARTLTPEMDLKRSWTSYAVEVREAFEDEFKKRLEEHLGMVVPSRKVCQAFLQQRCKEGAKVAKQSKKKAAAHRDHSDDGNLQTDPNSRPPRQLPLDFDDVTNQNNKDIHQTSGKLQLIPRNDATTSGLAFLEQNTRPISGHLTGQMPARQGGERIQRDSFDNTSNSEKAVNIVVSDSIDRSPDTRVPPTFSYTQYLNDDNTHSPASDGIRNSPIPSPHLLGNVIRREAHLGESLMVPPHDAESVASSPSWSRSPISDVSPEIVEFTARYWSPDWQGSDET